jgi:hypothetical protein
MTTRTAPRKTANPKTNGGKAAAPVKNPAKLTDEDNADIRAANRAEAEYLRTGEFYTVDELRAEFNL